MKLSDWAPAPNIACDPEVDGDFARPHHDDASLSYHVAVHEWRP